MAVRRHGSSVPHRGGLLAVQWRPHRTRQRDADRSGRQSLHDRALGQDSLWVAWSAGALYSAPGAYYLAGLALLAKQNASTATNVVVILGFNLIQFAPIELPLIGLVVVPDRARALTEKLNDWMTAHRRIVTVCLAGTIGAYLLISGIFDLG